MLFRSGSVVTVLEDVVTTGSSALRAVHALRDAGYIVNRVISIVDRMDNNAVWTDNELSHISLFTLQDVINE